MFSSCIFKFVEFFDGGFLDSWVRIFCQWSRDVQEVYSNIKEINSDLFLHENISYDDNHCGKNGLADMSL